MNPLTPDVTSVLARDVYDLRLSEDVSGLGAAAPEWRQHFNAPQRMTGTSGAILRSETGFGFIATGKGLRAREALVVMRGTASLADGITDGHCGIQLGPGGCVVHAGFNETFKSVRQQIDECLNAQENRGIGHVHCVGHSLGGALATLVADHARARGLGASLYTFGSPRVGFGGLSSQLTRALGSEQIFRVYHTNDPVSMVPLFPFVHLPSDGQVIMLPANYHAYDFTAHSMNGYVSDVSGRGWRSMRCAATNWLDRLDDKVQQWLDSSDRSALAHYGGNVLWFLGKALLRLLKLAVDVVGSGIQTLVTTGFTLLDTLAWLLERAAALSAQVNSILARILSALMSALGRAVGGVRNITAAVLRFALSFLLSSLGAQVFRAIALVHGGVR